MKIFPAIDIQNGQVVRLTHGDYGQVTRYALTPREAAESFVKAGATCVHIVDLDGAKDGVATNEGAIRALLSGNSLFAEVGGGIRTEAQIEAYLTAGAGRVILGTVAVTNFPFLAEMVKKYKSAIAVGVDARNGFVAVNGWLEDTKLDGVEFCKKLRDTGVSTVIYTDISRDGAMQGANLSVYRTLNAIEGLDIVASGGVSTLSDVEQLRDIGVSAAIVGKALYSGALDLKDVLACAGRHK